jgi:hypothetical protein
MKTISVVLTGLVRVKRTLFSLSSNPFETPKWISPLPEIWRNATFLVLSFLVTVFSCSALNDSGSSQSSRREKPPGSHSNTSNTEHKAKAQREGTTWGSGPICTSGTLQTRYGLLFIEVHFYEVYIRKSSHLAILSHPS